MESIKVVYFKLTSYFSCNWLWEKNCLERCSTDAIWNKVHYPLPDCDSDIRSV